MLMWPPMFSSLCNSCCCVWAGVGDLLLTTRIYEKRWDINSEIRLQRGCGHFLVGLMLTVREASCHEVSYSCNKEPMSLARPSDALKTANSHMNELGSRASLCWPLRWL